ncbi:hypothetical protein [Tychonema sp. LEGE 07203]|uniref:hypothetical protein n=1 Tax=Tychonema sp. LEGE 07203 TaxID=1828671 RepID=UPI00187EED69|nr:hypothetical protein [Tychonema sp. LEGE 07203]MBE9093177.1 hypothetical protein [Tychonema sp. LEGE 07203]
MEAAHKDLLQQIARLSETYGNLADRLSQAARQLQDSGLPPSDSLLQEIASYSRNFAGVQKQALELNKSALAPGEITSLKDIQNLVETATASEGKAEIRDAALKALDRVLAIAHREQSDFPPLQSVHAKARELQRAISESAPTQLHSDAESLVSGKHPVAAVLALVEQQDKLDDQQWVILEETVSAAFGKQIAVAISRGKLTVAQMVKAAPAKVEPAFKAAPEPKMGAQALPEVIIIPSGNVAPKQVAVAPKIEILESPAATAPMHEVIIVPSVEVPKSLEKTGSGNIVFGIPREIQQAPVEGGLGLKVLAHIQGIGDRTFGPGEYAGTKGRGLRVEGFQINIEPPISGLTVEYMAHVEGVGDTPWIGEGELAGFRGQAKRIEGFAVRLSGAQADKYDVFYSAHIQNIGDTDVSSNGDYCGTRGKALRIEGIKVWIAPSASSRVAAAVGLKVLAHIQGIGDRTFGDKEYAGTKAQGRRVEGFQIKIEPPVPGLNLQYMAHVEGIGDTPWIGEGELAGFRGKAKRIEGFAARLTGPQADKYDVFYTAHIQNLGDTPVTSNGQYCGTRGKGLRVEGMTVWVEPKA